MLALPPHNNEQAVNVWDDKEKDVVLALQDAHFTVIMRCIQQHTQEQLSNLAVKFGFQHGHFNPLPST